jgi:hypothetical protein
MDMKRTLRIAYAAIVLGALAVPALTMPFQKPADTENLSPAPTLKAADGGLTLCAGEAAEAYIADRFGLHDTLRSGYGLLSAEWLKTSAEPAVIVGHSGWLYGADTVGDATGAGTLSADALRHAVHVLELMRSYCTEHGSRMIFACAPDKVSVYPQYLPMRYVHTGGQNNLDGLMQAFTHANITVCDLRKKLTDAAAESEYPLYYLRDSHWNGDGAMTAFAALMRSAGHNDQNLPQAHRMVSSTHSGDLWEMLMPGVSNPEEEPAFGIPNNHTEAPDSTAALRRTVQPHAKGSLLFFGDDFAEPMIPFFAECFGEAAFSLEMPCHIDLLETQPADYVFVEIAEKRIADLLTQAPVMPAPAAEKSGVLHELSGIAPPTAHSETVGGYLHIYGDFDARYSDHEAVLVTVGSGDSARTYEAFPCCETALLGLDSPASNCYSLYLPADALAGESTVGIAVMRDRQTYLLGEAAL